MKPRIDYRKAAPDAFKAMLELELEAGVRRGGLEKPLIELVKMRASQINDCTRCRHGAKHRSTARANAPRWPGPKR